MGSLRWIPFVWVIAASNCNRHPANADDCEAILHRLVEIELSESGYQDPVLHARWQQDVVRRFALDLDRCRGRKVPNSLRACLTKASNSEEIAHGCLD
jgi:hypothetical protein